MRRTEERGRGRRERRVVVRTLLGQAGDLWRALVVLPLPSAATGRARRDEDATLLLLLLLTPCASLDLRRVDTSRVRLPSRDTVRRANELVGERGRDQRPAQLDSGLGLGDARIVPPSLSRTVPTSIAERACEARPLPERQASRVRVARRPFRELPSNRLERSTCTSGRIVSVSRTQSWREQQRRVLRLSSALGACLETEANQPRAAIGPERPAASAKQRGKKASLEERQRPTTVDQALVVLLVGARRVLELVELDRRDALGLALGVVRQRDLAHGADSRRKQLLWMRKRGERSRRDGGVGARGPAHLDLALVDVGREVRDDDLVADVDTRGGSSTRVGVAGVAGRAATGGGTGRGGGSGGGGRGAVARATGAARGAALALLGDDVVEGLVDVHGLRGATVVCL